MKLKDRNCILTGSSHGLGAHIARRFWDEGASLLLVGRDEGALQRLCDGLGPPPGSQRVSWFRCDLSETGATARITQAARRTFEFLTVLVNNAAITGPMGPIWENDWELWERVIRVDLLAPAQLVAEMVPWMAEQHYGKIINLSGGGASDPRPNFTAYSSAKAALVRLTESVAHETRTLGIDVNAMSPGVMKTAMLSEVYAAGPEKIGAREFDRINELLRETASQDPAVALDRAANLAVFLASAESDGITGRMISAVWDPWETLHERLPELNESDIYTLRRIVPEDRGKTWGKD